MPKKTNAHFRMPAEWEKQQSTLIGWPYNKDDWPDKFKNIPEVFAKIVSKITMSQKVNLLIKETKSILVFSGEGSKLLSKKSIYLKEEYNHFDDMSFFEENSSLICDSAFDYDRSDISNEVVIVPKRQQKTGLFEKLFYLFSN